MIFVFVLDEKETKKRTQTRQDKTRQPQDRTRQDKTRQPQDKTRQPQDKTRQDKTTTRQDYHKTNPRQPQDSHKTRQPQDNHKITARQPQGETVTRQPQDTITTRQPKDNHKTRQPQDKTRQDEMTLSFISLWLLFPQQFVVEFTSDRRHTNPAMKKKIKKVGRPNRIVYSTILDQYKKNIVHIKRNNLRPIKHVTIKYNTTRKPRSSAIRSRPCRLFWQCVLPASGRQNKEKYHHA